MMSVHGSRLWITILLPACLIVAGLQPRACAAGGAGQASNVVAEGSAAISTDENAAKKHAIDKALRSAVCSALGRSIAPQDVEAHVKTYRVISGSVEDGRYVVRVAATVTRADNSMSQHSQLRWSGNPRIAVVIPETILDRFVPDPAGETEVTSRLIQARFDVREPSDIGVIRYDVGFGQVIKQADVAAMKRFGAKYKCDILVCGEAFASHAGTSELYPGYPLASARIEVKAFVVDTGEMLAAGSATGGAAAPTLEVAEKQAIQKSAESLCIDRPGEPGLVTALHNAILEQNRTITLRITGLYAASQLDSLQKAIQRVAGVESVQRRSFGGDFAELDVECSLLTSQLSHTLLGISDPLLSVSSSTGSQIDLAVVRR